MHACYLDPQAFGRGHPLLSPALAMLLFGIAIVVSLLSPIAASSRWIALLTPIVENRWGIGREV